jgi:HlyD family secretion protein
MTVKQWSLAGLKYALMLCGVVFLGQFAAANLTSWWGSAADQPQYLFATVTRGPLETLVSSTGILAALETVEVGTQVSGTIARLEVDYNDRVRKGQVLAVLDQALFAAQVKEAEANVTKARATLAQAEDEYRRNRPLFDKGFLSAQEFLPISTGVDTARAGLAAAEASLTRAQTNLAYTVIRSPIDGTVIKRSIEAGQTVAASLNTPTLFLIARDLAQMQIEADVDESDIGQIRTGQEVRFTVQSYPGDTFRGTVSQIRLQPRTISNVVNYTVLVDASNDRGLLLPGMTATIDFVVNRVENALLVPNAALRFQPQEENPGTNPAKSAATKGAADEKAGRLFTLEGDGRLQDLPVTKGASDGIKTAISGAGIREGLQVVSGLKPAEKVTKGNFFSFLRPPRPGGGAR